MSVLALMIGAAGESGATAAGTPWYKVATGVIAVPTALLGIYAALQLSRKTRLEMQKLQLEIVEKERTSAGSSEETDDGLLISDAAARSPRVIAVSIESYVIRFILLYVASEFIGLLSNIVQPALAFSGYFFREGPVAVQYAVGVFSSYVYVAFQGLVFLTLGLPLLNDILQSLGLTKRDLISRNLRSELRHEHAGRADDEMS